MSERLVWAHSSSWLGPRRAEGRRAEPAAGAGGVCGADRPGGRPLPGGNGFARSRPAQAARSPRQARRGRGGLPVGCSGWWLSWGCSNDRPAAEHRGRRSSSKQTGRGEPALRAGARPGSVGAGRVGRTGQAGSQPKACRVTVSLHRPRWGGGRVCGDTGSPARACWRMAQGGRRPHVCV